MNVIKILNISLVVIILGVVAYGGYIDHAKPLTCTESYKVEKILALQYRDAVILLSNGKELTVNQARLKIGDDYCVKVERL